MTRKKKNILFLSVTLLPIAWLCLTGARFVNAFFASDYVLEVLEDHTKGPANPKHLTWLRSHKSELSVWNLTHDSNIDYARALVDISLVYLYFDSLSNHEKARMLVDARSWSHSIDPDYREMGDVVLVRLGESGPTGEKTKKRSIERAARFIRTTPEAITPF